MEFKRVELMDHCSTPSPLLRIPVPQVLEGCLWESGGYSGGTGAFVGVVKRARASAENENDVDYFFRYSVGEDTIWADSSDDDSPQAELRQDFPFQEDV